MKEVGFNHWFVAQLRPNGLNRAETHLQRQGFETFAPKIQAVTLQRGIRRETRKPLFSGYLFLRFDPNQADWRAINATRGVVRLVLNDPRRPEPLPKALIEGLFARCDATGLLLPPADLAVGDKIRILSGPFADLLTTIEAIPDQERIAALIDILGGRVKTYLPRANVERIF